MTQNTLTKQYFKDLINQVMAALLARDWAKAHENARQYTQQMNTAFTEGYHQIALEARKGLSALREPTYHIRSQGYENYKSLVTNRLYKAFVVQYCPLDPWQAKSFLLHDDSGSDRLLVENILKNGFFRSKHLVDDVEKNSEAMPRLIGSIEFIEALMQRNNVYLASKLIEGLLYDPDLRESPFVFNDQFVQLLCLGANNLFFHDFLERMAPRIDEICEWSHQPGNLRHDCLKAHDREGILKLAEVGLPDLAEKLYVASKAEFESKGSLVRAEQLFERRFSLPTLIRLSNTGHRKNTLEALIEYFFQDPDSKWPFYCDDTHEKIDALGERSRYVFGSRTIDEYGDFNDRALTLKSHSVVLLDALERHKSMPGFEAKRSLLMQLYVSSHKIEESFVYREIKNLYPMDLLMEVPSFGEERLQDDLNL